MKRTLLVAIIFLLVSSLVLGCSPARRVDPDTNNGTRMDQNGNMVPDQNNRVPRDPRMDEDNDRINNNDRIGNNNEELSRRIAEIATDVDGVDNATVVVTGDTAYVGIDMDKDLENEDTDRLKERVGDRIKDRVDSIDRVYVSADVDTVERLREIGRDIRGGRPISGFLNELTEMFRRPMPRAE